MLYCHKKCIGWHKKWLYSNDKTKNVYCSSNGILILFRHTRQKYVLFSLVVFCSTFLHDFCNPNKPNHVIQNNKKCWPPSKLFRMYLKSVKTYCCHFWCQCIYHTLYTAIVKLHCVYGGCNKYLLILFNKWFGHLWCIMKC